MPVRKVSAEEILGGKSVVMAANPYLLKGLKKLRLGTAQNRSSAQKSDQISRDGVPSAE